MGAGKKPTIGYRYFMGIHAILCRGPIDKIKEIYFADRLAWSGEITDSQSIQINKPDLFGGEKKEGGVQGQLDIMIGEPTQQKNPYLQEKIQTLVPAFRGVVSAVFRSFYFSAMTPYLKPVSFVVERIPQKDWLPDIANINGAANPAHALLDMLTHPEWGMGYAQINCNMDQFEAAAQTLYDEGFGLSFTISSEDDYERIIEMLMTHVNGLFYTEPDTGLFSIKLLRGDYLDAIETLPVYGEGNAELDEFERPSYAEIVNEITIKYRPQSTTKDDTVTVTNLAAVQNQGAKINLTVSYPAIDNADLAAYVASRDLRQKSTPLAKFKLRVNRLAWNLKVGDVFVFSWPRLNIAQLIGRAIQIDYGTIEEGVVVIDAVEDVFGLPVANYIVNQPSLWVNPEQDPEDPVSYKVSEATYFDIVQTLGEIDGPAIVNDLPGVGFIKACVAASSYSSPSFELWTPTGIGDTSVARDPEYPVLDPITTASIGTTDTTIPIRSCDSSKFFYLVNGDEFTINGETFEFVSMTDTQIVVATRTGSSHPSGSKVLFQPNPNAANPPAIVAALDESTVVIGASGFMYDTDLTYIQEDEYYLIDSEIVKVTDGSITGAVTILRAQKGTVAATHSAGTYFRSLVIPVRATNIYEQRGISEYAPTLVTSFGVGAEVTTVLNSFEFNGRPEDVTVGFYGEWEDEIVKVVYLDYNIAIINRGCLDTVPTDHASGTTIFFCQDNQAFSDYQYLEGDEVLTKLRPRSLGRLLDIDEATENTTLMTNRAAKPYAPGNVKINGQAYPAVISGPISITWSHRSRLLQTADIVIQSDGDIGPETGTEYRVEIVGEGDLVTTATEFSWCAPTDTVVTVTLGSTCNSLNSHQGHTITFERSGWGYNWGNYWGGTGPDGTSLVTCVADYIREFQRPSSNHLAARFENMDGSYLAVFGTNEPHGPGSDFYFTAKLYDQYDVEVDSVTAGHRIAGQILYDATENASYMCFNRLGIDTVGADQITRISVTDCSQIITSGTDLIGLSEPDDVGPMAIMDSKLWVFAGGKLKNYALDDITPITSYTGIPIPLYATGEGQTLFTLNGTALKAYDETATEIYATTLDTSCACLIFAEGWLWTLTGLPGVVTNWGVAKIDPDTGLMDTYFLSLTEASGGVFDPPFDSYLPSMTMIDGLIVIAGAADTTPFVVNPVTGTLI